MVKMKMCRFLENEKQLMFRKNLMSSVMSIAYVCQENFSTFMKRFNNKFTVVFIKVQTKYA